jgi:2-oxoglutarate ferredoxin oxidoreductase subunit alpha
MPRVGGTFIQMEDELASISAIIGASAAGAVAMTATSGPGFSLMQENLGYAYMVQLPIVIAMVQRGGPSTGLPTMLSQSDTMQTRWGTHGDYTSIVIASSSVQESYDLTLRAFKLAERFSTPVILLLDELVGHMMEKVTLHMSGYPEPVKRSFPEIPPEWYKPYRDTLDLISHPAPFGEGYRYNITGLVHDESGFPTSNSSEIKSRLKGLRNKVLMHCQEIWDYREHYTEDARYLLIAYGSAARAARGAVESLRKNRIKAGLIDLKTVWPFPHMPISQIAEKAKTRHVFVVENNMGQLIHPVKETIINKGKVFGINRYDGHTINPYEIINFVKEKINE